MLKRIEESPYSYGPSKGIECKGGLTDRSFQKEADVNNVVGRYIKTRDAMILTKNGSQPLFADVSNVQDFQTALNMVNAVKGIFDALPATIKEKFQNDPAVLVDFVTNPANAEAVGNLGLGPKVIKPEGAVKKEPATPAPKEPGV